MSTVIQVRDSSRDSTFRIGELKYIAAVAEARALGAYGVVATRLGTSQVMSGAAEVLAYGTAVTLE